MSVNQWLKDVPAHSRQAHDQAISAIALMPGMQEPAVRLLFARSWGKVAHDLALVGEQPSPDDMLYHVSGDTFMESLAVSGDALLVNRRMSRVETGSDEWLSMKGDALRFQQADTLLRSLSDACEEMRRVLRHLPACDAPRNANHSIIAA